MISAFLAIALLFSTIGNAGSHKPLLVQLHELDWADVDAGTVVRSHPGYFQRTDLEIPQDSFYATGGKCDGSTYLVHDGGAEYVRLEFERVANAQNCSTRLKAVTVEEVLPRTAAELRRLDIIAGLRATGPVVGAPDEYQWRSDDSRVKFVLSVFAKPPADPRKDPTVKVVARLLHLSVVPESVDALPFRRGYFPPSCNR